MEGIAEMHSKLRKTLAGVATVALSIIGLSPLAAVSPAAASVAPSVQDFESFGFIGFGGDMASISDNGYGDHFLQVIRGDQCWSGTTIETLTGTEFISSFTGTTITATLYAPAAGLVVKLKLEDSTNSNVNVESDYTTTQQGWQLATWAFSNQVENSTYNKSNVFFNFTCANNLDKRASSVWKLDNFTYDAHALTGSSPVNPTNQNFDGINPMAIGFGHDLASIIEGPRGGHLLKVVQGNETWSGTTIDALSSGEYISTSTSMTVRALIDAPVPGAHVKLKLEDSSNSSISVEKDYVATNRGVQMATWDFTGATGFTNSNTYNKASVFFDFGRTDRVGTTWYLDNLSYGGDTAASCSPIANARVIRLENPALDTAVNAFDGTSWVTQYVTAGSSAYVQYLTVGASFSLTYVVTDTCGSPISGLQVSLKVNKNWSCSNASFTAGGVAIGPDDCNGHGEATLSAQSTNASGQVTFNLTNTNAPGGGESTPAAANEDPTAHSSQVKTNIVPYIDGSEVADYFFAHFVRDPNWHPPVCIPTATKVIRFLNPAMVPGQNAYDATGWVEPYITKGSKAYLQYLHAGDSMKLTYVVTNNCGTPFADQPVKLKVNANWSCSNATYNADGKAIGPDNCNGGGETVLAARNTNAAVFVTFELTNINNPATAEPTPSSLTGPPSAAVTAAKQEVKTNIQPYIDGTEVIDLYFAHFTRDPKVSLTAPSSVVKGVRSKITMNLMGSNAAAVSGAKVALKVTGAGSVAGNTLIGTSTGNLYAITDASGNASVNYLASASDSGSVTVTASYTDAAGLTTSKSATFTLTDPVVLVPTIKVTGASGAVKINAVNAKGKSITVVKAGSRKSYTYGLHANNETFTIAAAPGDLTVIVFVDGKPQTFQVKVN